MYKQVVHTYSYDGSGGPYNFPADWLPTNVAGYDTVAITIESTNGWDGSVSFWAGAGTDESSPALWALNSASNASLVTQVTNVVGATPSAFYGNYRGSIAGLSEFGFYFADATTFESAVGTIKVSLGFYSSAK
jgi:hypothetical protein